MTDRIDTKTAGRRAELTHELAELVQALEQTPQADSLLDDLTEGAARFVPGAQHAGITIISRGHKVRTVASTGRYPTLLDEIQQRHNQGPCLSAAWEQHIMRIPDLASEKRWPAYCRDALAESPIRSVMSFQMFAHRHTMGALNLFAEQPEAFDDDTAELGLIAATHTALGWELVRRDEQFRSALASRDIIGQAKGMIMERFTIDAVQAFELLKRLSQGSNTPVVEVARQLAESTTADPSTAAPR